MEWFLVSPWMVALLFLVAVAAAFIDSIAGGGGLLTVPALLAAGLSPAHALATNKLQSVGGSFSASLYFVRRGAVRLAEQRLNIAMTFIGAMLGAILIQHLRADVLRQILPVLLIGIGLWFLLMPKLGETDRASRLSGLPYAFVGGGCVGFYDGFFGPGAGSFYALAFVTLCGFNLAKATAHAKVLNFTSNLAGLLFFMFGGQVVWGLGAVMLLGAFCGARLGARLVLTRGHQLIRPMVVTVSVVMSLKLLWDSHGQTILRALGH
ncbi:MULTISPECIES: TSUP family transporter [Tatumella]|uniref:Probable membrane transporter protein n=1 Tax=Tatumella punctata TaxID=399969 RepID=A0ABW1VPC1_9GAMM|nr:MULTISPECIES: TSUP family transporter [unclassified Tatumella]MBS0854908.1 TSUP family transporter [Tatumella sp. JGM16]MBS0876405.1 TSUP family transporter [Tatumella sp. JGM82]MBS0889578.1 TSUP family transporter [Tatumella sp. JGM94]MBS0893064.1 TSUP family transporter [Tatumella sp. JGM130]MBS0900700.1 TSUP family transporter [Tatumella sp. JGM100]